VCAAGGASAAPVDVTYTVTGSSGDWTLDFTVANNMTGSGQSIDFFGLSIDGPVSGSPTHYSPFSGQSYTVSNYYGSTVLYSDFWVSWRNSPTDVVQVGSSTSGFLVHLSDAVVPTDINWFAFTDGTTCDYTGGDNNITGSYNTGFEGIAHVQDVPALVVPEPANVALLLAGLGMVGAAAKRRAKR
jgi:hypothetical protein